MTTMMLSTFFYQKPQHDAQYYYEHPEQQHDEEHDDLLVYEQPHLVGVLDNDSSYSSTSLHDEASDYCGTQPLHHNNNELPSSCQHDGSMFFPQLHSECSTQDCRKNDSNDSCCKCTSSGIVRRPSAETLSDTISNGLHDDQLAPFQKQKPSSLATLVLSASTSNLQKLRGSDDPNNDDNSSHNKTQQQHLLENGHKYAINYHHYYHHGAEKSRTIPLASVSSSHSSSLLSSSNSPSASYPTTIIPSSSSLSYLSNTKLLTDHMKSQQLAASFMSFRQRTTGTSSLLQDAKIYFDSVNFNDNIFDDDDDYNYEDNDDDGSWCYDDNGDNGKCMEDDENTDYVDLEVGKNESTDSTYLSNSKTVHSVHSDGIVNDENTLDGSNENVAKDEQLPMVTSSQWHNTQSEPTRRQHVKFIDVCMVVEIPHYTDYTIEELDQMYTDSNMIQLLAERNVYEVRYEYELQQEKQLARQQQAQQDIYENKVESHVRVYLDEEDYFTCYKDDSTRILLHPAHVAHAKLVGNGQALDCIKDARHYDLISNNQQLDTKNNSYSTIEIRWCRSKEEMSMHSPVFLFPDEELFRQQILMRSLLQELMLGLV